MLYHLREITKINGKKVIRIKSIINGQTFIERFEDFDGKELVWNDDNNLVEA